MQYFTLNMGQSLKQGAHSKELGFATRIILNWIFSETKTGYEGMNWIHLAHCSTKIGDISFAQSRSFSYHLHAVCVAVSINF
jgi:hypothetical protein